MLTPLHHALLYAAVRQGIEALPAAGHDALTPHWERAWVVGGFLRDTLVRLLHGVPTKPKDLDVMVADVGSEYDVAAKLTGLGHGVSFGSLGGVKVGGVDLWFVSDFGSPIPAGIEAQALWVHSRIESFPLTCQRLALHVPSGTFVYPEGTYTPLDIQSRTLRLGKYCSLTNGLIAKLPRLVADGWTIAPDLGQTLQYSSAWQDLVAVAPALVKAIQPKQHAVVESYTAVKQLVDKVFGGVSLKKSPLKSGYIAAPEATLVTSELLPKKPTTWQQYDWIYGQAATQSMLDTIKQQSPAPADEIEF